MGKALCSECAAKTGSCLVRHNVAALVPFFSPGAKTLSVCKGSKGAIEVEAERGGMLDDPCVDVSQCATEGA